MTHQCHLPLSTPNNEVVTLYNDVIRQYVTWTENEVGMEATLTKMLQSDDNFVMGKVLSAGLDLMGTTRSARLDATFSKEVNELKEFWQSETSNLTYREKLHCKAVYEFATEQHKRACNTWESILFDYPNDILALKFAHDAYFYLGNSRMIRDSVARVLARWDKTHPYYGYLHGMLAFGLEETNLFTLAENHARQALTLNRTDCWATHALAHCFEMNGRTVEGIDFMKSTESEWNKGAMLACHNYWHWALYHIERGEYESAAGIYDQQVGVRVKSGAALDIVDATSLLHRLQLEGVDVGERWDDIYELCRPHVDDHIMVFNDAHYLMSYLGAKKGSSVDDFMRSVHEYIENNTGDAKQLTQRVGVQLFEGLIAFSEQRFDDVVEALYPIKNELVNIGGSHAQRDVFQQVLLHACVESTCEKNVHKARALLDERKIKKETSPLTDRLMNRLLLAHEK